MERIPGYTALYYWFGIVLMWQAKRLKFEEIEEKRSLRIRDLLWFFVLSMGVGAGLCLERRWVNALLFIITGTLFVAMWLDAVVMNLFSIQINLHVLRIYLSNAAQMRNETSWALGYVARKPALALFPVASLAFYYLLILGQTSELWFALALLALYFGTELIVSRRRFAPAVASAWASANAILGSRAAPDLLVGTVPKWLGDSAVGLFLARLACKNKPEANSLRSSQLAEKSISVPPATDDAAGPLGPEGPCITPIPLRHQQRSDWFGQCGSSNIVLVTLESISQSQVAALSGQGAKMPVFETLARKGLCSRRHFCISPNTNNALIALYNGNYHNDLSFPHLKVLHAKGYKSVAVVPQDCAGFGFNQLLHDIGFQHVIDLNTFPEYTLVKDADSKRRVYLVDDEQFYQMAFDRLKQIIGPQDKLFLHVMNSQTHFPYVTHTQTPHGNTRIRYIQAVEEADNSLGQFLLQLDELVSLRKTLMVYTADHGESFGERGYKAHSTAITREQINVPFALNYPDMPHVEVPFSTHFDVFPTIFDLLGLQYDYPAIGSSMMIANRELNEVLFSETRHGHTPSCYGHVGPAGKVFFDVALDRYYLMDLDDRSIKELSGTARHICQATLLSALQARGLVDPSWRGPTPGFASARREISPKNLATH